MSQSLRELLADGTAVIMCHELNSHKSEEFVLSKQSVPEVSDKSVDENKEQTSDENKIKASDFINRLKANTSINKCFSENPNKRQNTEDITDCQQKKPKKPKKNGSKGLTKYLEKHYNTEDKKDYETVFNTSFNKYGREVIPRTERPDFTQLFSDQNNSMNLTQISECSQDISDRTDDMAITLNKTSLNISVCLTDSDVDSEQTKHFTDESMALTAEETDANTTQLSISSDSEEIIVIRRIDFSN